MSGAGYKAVLRLFRQMLVECCGIPDDLKMEWGTQSCRSGGDTELWKQGYTAAERRDVGMWACAKTEQGYLRLRVGQRFEKMRKFGL